jgi:hypothetical protein
MFPDEPFFLPVFTYLFLAFILQKNIGIQNCDSHACLCPEHPHTKIIVCSVIVKRIGREGLFDHQLSIKYFLQNRR